MKTLILILILAALVQSAFLPINLVLLILISRSLVVEDLTNLYLAFGSGILVGITQSENIGLLALIFLLAVKIGEISKHLPFSSSILIVIPVSLVIMFLSALAEQIFLGHTIQFSQVLIEAVVSFPIFIMVKFWEERFVVPSGVKLKLNK